MTVSAGQADRVDLLLPAVLAAQVAYSRPLFRCFNSGAVPPLEHPVHYSVPMLLAPLSQAASAILHSARLRPPAKTSTVLLTFQIEPTCLPPSRTGGYHGAAGNEA